MTVAAVLLAGPTLAADKPNIVIIWGDDIGQSNISAYSRGLMGYRTPNIDRVASEGCLEILAHAAEDLGRAGVDEMTARYSASPELRLRARGIVPTKA